MWKDLLWGGNLFYTVIWKHNNHFNLAECKLNWVGCLAIIPQNTSPYLGTLCSWLLNRGLKCVQVHLYAFFIVNITTLHDLQLFESEDAEQWIWRNSIYQGPTMSCKLYMDFWLHRGSAPLILQRSKMKELAGVVPKMAWLSICLPKCFYPCVLWPGESSQNKWVHISIIMGRGRQLGKTTMSENLVVGNLPQLEKLSENFSFLCKLIYFYCK